MGSRELLAGLLWRLRAGVRAAGLPVRAGHGMADAAYRPPALPYGSVVGPLTVELEPERDPPRAVYLPVQAPGYLAGRTRTPADTVPAPGPLTLRLDGDTLAAADVNFGARQGQPFTDPDVGPAAATTLEQALRASTFTVAGAAVTDPDRIAELAQLTARWDAPRRRFVVASGRRGVITGTDLLARQPSSVEPAGPPSASMTALGLAGDGVVVAPGRVVRHRRPTPTAVAVDVRVDLWAGSQSDLASVLDAWTRITATRGRVLIRPAVLAQDVDPADTEVRLLSPAEPAARDSLVLLDLIDGVARDRITGRAATLVGGPVVAGGRLALDGAERAELDFFDLPAIPVAWAPESPTSNGYAATVGLAAPPAAAGQTLRLLTITGQGREALRLDIAFTAGAAELRATAMRANAGDFAPATATVDQAALNRGIEVHVALDARRGGLSLAVGGDVVAGGEWHSAGPPVGGAGMRLVLGVPAGAPANPSALSVRHLHLHGSPAGPPDPRLRLSAAPASAWSPGETFTLARSADGVSAAGDGVAATVLGVQGDRVLLDRPVQASFPRLGSIAYLRGEFFSQRTLRRSDDLMNQLYRMCAEYRVSTVLDELDPGVSAPLVESTDVQVRDFARLAAELAAAAATTDDAADAAAVDQPDGDPAPAAANGRPRTDPTLARPVVSRPGTTAIFTTNPPRNPIRTAAQSTAQTDSTEESHG